MNLSEMRRLLETRGLRLTRSLGQNFLHDGNQLRRIAGAAGLSGVEPVLEIGPGLGPLTEQLLERAGRVLAVEKDARLVEVLQDRFGTDPRIELVTADALDWLREGGRDWSDWWVVSNLPYSVGSPILVELAMAARPPRRMVVLLQEEVVDRITARAGTADYGVLGLLVGLQFKPRESFRVPRDCFFPAPDVESACVVLDRREGLEEVSGLASTYGRVVKTGFGQRRKMLLKLLAAVWPREAVVAAMSAAGVSVTERAERLTREQFVTIAAALTGEANAPE
jgi:16S rRNA (adenine1518-N6/adenine1519-N6)-dimethyltransferase